MAWHDVASADEIREEEPVAVSVGATLIALYRLDQQVYGTSNVCTHQFALMSDGYVEDDCIECPLHQARFHIPTGEHRGGPDCDRLKTYPVKIEAGRVYVECD